MKILAGSYEPTSPIAFAEIVTKENSTSVLSSLGWGTAGLVALGPLGFVAGAIGGSSKQRTIVAIKYANGNSALVECKNADTRDILTAAFRKEAVVGPKSSSSLIGTLGLISLSGVLMVIVMILAS